eukprot:gene12676-15598_t
MPAEMGYAAPQRACGACAASLLCAPPLLEDDGGPPPPPGAMVRIRSALWRSRGLAQFGAFHCRVHESPIVDVAVPPGGTVRDAVGVVAGETARLYDCGVRDCVGARRAGGVGDPARAATWSD